MTGVGAHRARYAVEVEHRPSRFAEPAAYSAWAARADAWKPGSEPREATADDLEVGDFARFQFAPTTAHFLTVKKLWRYTAHRGWNLGVPMIALQDERGHVTRVQRSRPVTIARP